MKKIQPRPLDTFYTVAQSICTHYSCFENMGRIVPLKKIRSKICVAKSRVQKTGSLLLLFFQSQFQLFHCENVPGVSRYHPSVQLQFLGNFVGNFGGYSFGLLWIWTLFKAFNLAIKLCTCYVSCSVHTSIIS